MHMGTNRKARQSCGDGTPKVEHSAPGLFLECIGTSAEVGAHGQIITTQSVKFEGSRLSQHGCTSMHQSMLCMCTSLPIESWTRNPPHDMRCQAYYRPRARAKWHHKWRHAIMLRHANMDITTHRNVVTPHQHYMRPNCGTSLDASKQK